MPCAYYRHPEVRRARGNIGFAGQVTHRFAPRTPEHYFIELGFELNYFIELSSRAPLFGGKMPPKIKLLLFYDNFLFQKNKTIGIPNETPNKYIPTLFNKFMCYSYWGAKIQKKLI